MPVKVTPEFIDAGKSEAGGWTKEQLAILGVEWPPRKGWRGRVKTWISEEESFRFRRAAVARKPLPLVEACCQTCRFWEDNGEVEVESGFDKGDRYGYCVRFPPVLDGERWSSPEVMSFEWCGEYVLGEERRPTLPIPR